MYGVAMKRYEIRSAQTELNFYSYVGDERVARVEIVIHADHLELADIVATIRGAGHGTDILEFAESYCTRYNLPIVGEMSEADDWDYNYHFYTRNGYQFYSGDNGSGNGSKNNLKPTSMKRGNKLKWTGRFYVRKEKDLLRTHAHTKQLVKN